MAKVYHSVPLDDENLDGKPEKHVRSIRIDGELLSSTAQRASKHWIWLVHAILLSVSMTLFTITFCNKAGKPTDLSYTRKYSSYCECDLRRRARANG